MLRALRELAQSTWLIAISTFYREPAIDRPHGPYFYNGVLAAETGMPAVGFKWQVLRRIEADLGRRRTGDKNASRTIDLDLLLYGDRVLSTDELTLSDPHLRTRAFIAAPLCDLAPTLRLPGSGLPIREVAAQLSMAGMESLPRYTLQLRQQLLGNISQTIQENQRG
ncbi:MAG: 2-amino-4-hydroxy-6-hydroxymethyldihydropteridine diphosphokinase [Acetobacteraceae bacterium]